MGPVEGKDSCVGVGGDTGVGKDAGGCGGAGCATMLVKSVELAVQEVMVEHKRSSAWFGVLER